MNSQDNILSSTDRENIEPVNRSAELVSFAAATFALTACGGSDDVSSTAPVTAPAPGPGPGPAPGPAPGPGPGPAPPFTIAEASRLVAQGGFGANRAELERVRNLGSAATWINEQLAMPRTQCHFAWMD